MPEQNIYMHMCVWVCMYVCMYVYIYMYFYLVIHMLHVYKMFRWVYANCHTSVKRERM